jgi:hypothetical protein
MVDWAEQNSIAVNDRDELEEYINNGELLLVAEEMREKLGKTGFHDFMMEQFRQSKPKPTSTHQWLPKIPFSAVLTTNYDRLLEKTYEDSYKDASFHMFTNKDYPELAMALRSGEPYLLKTHGTIDRIETIVLGTKDYREVMHNNPAYRQYLRTLFSSKTVLFLGFGLTDPDLNLLLEEMRAIFHDYTTTHYALMNTKEVPSIKQKRFKKDFNIKILPYIPSASHHPEVEDFLKQLAREVKKIGKNGEDAKTLPQTNLSSGIGVSLKYSELEREVAERLLTYLEDRRALYSTVSSKCPKGVIKSIHEKGVGACQ